MSELFDALQYRAQSSADMVAYDDGLTRLAYPALARRVAGAAEELQAIAESPQVIGLLGGNRLDWIVGQLAGWYADRIVVPLPSFFRLSQLRHVVQDAGICHLLTSPETVGTARQLGVPFSQITGREAEFRRLTGKGGAQVIYTSGSTGQPKGALLKGVQITWIAQALAKVTGANADDTYLSALPLALLLETVSALAIPILVGARVRLDPRLSALFAEDGCPLANSVEACQPTCMVLVPQQLAKWVAQLQEAGAKAPHSLRFVAVGGASVAPDLAQRAWDLGIPVHEGYGLSECGSVVAVNGPGQRKPGTVGKPLPGLDLSIEAGEIVVRGPSVMSRYLYGPPTHGVWRTGDLGELDDDGNLVVFGRADNVIIAASGRNISSEWIESLISADPRVAFCTVMDGGDDGLVAVVVPALSGQEWFDAASIEDLRALIAECCRDAPAYAFPGRLVILPETELVRFGLLTTNGRIRRKHMLDTYASLLRFNGVNLASEVAGNGEA